MLVVKLLTWICYVAVISFPLNFQSGVSLEAAKGRTVTHTLKGTDTFRTCSYSWITKSSNSSGPQMLCQFVSVFFSYELQTQMCSLSTTEAEEEHLCHSCSHKPMQQMPSSHFKADLNTLWQFSSQLSTTAAESFSLALTHWSESQRIHANMGYWNVFTKWKPFSISCWCSWGLFGLFVCFKQGIGREVCSHWANHYCPSKDNNQPWRCWPPGCCYKPQVTLRLTAELHHKTHICYWYASNSSFNIKLNTLMWSLFT